MSNPTRKVTIKQVKGLTFAGLGETSGHWTMMDARKSVGGHEGATTPMELLLMAVGGCTGMDVVSILTKMKQPFQDIQIEVKGTMQEADPYAYTSIHIHYIIKGNVEAEKVERAIELSQNKYCSVAATLRAQVKITNTYEIEPGGAGPNA